MCKCKELARFFENMSERLKLANPEAEMAEVERIPQGLIILSAEAVPGLTWRREQANRSKAMLTELWPKRKCGMKLAAVETRIGEVLFLLPASLGDLSTDLELGPLEVLEQLRDPRTNQQFLSFCKQGSKRLRRAAGAEIVGVRGVGALIVKEARRLIELDEAGFCLPLVLPSESGKWRGEDELKRRAQVALELFEPGRSELRPYFARVQRQIMESLLLEGGMNIEQLALRSWEEATEATKNNFYVQMHHLRKRLEPFGLGIEKSALGPCGHDYELSLLTLRQELVVVLFKASPSGVE